MGSPDASPGKEVNLGENQIGKEFFQWFIPKPGDDFEILAVHHNRKIVRVKKVTKQNPTTHHGSLKIIETREIGAKQIKAIDEYFNEYILPIMDYYDSVTAREIYKGVDCINKVRRVLEPKKRKIKII